jgi:acetyl/propionyl-CoA carboxylase alpha subunit
MIKRLLVANRGEIARRIFASCRATGVETVAVYSDADAGAPHVREADYAVHLPGNAPSATYLRADLLVAAARRAGADAVHPGYGFLAENADFAQAVLDAGLTWIGPSPKAITAMGDKREAKRLLADAGIPMLPTYDDPESVIEFPVLVKACGSSAIRMGWPRRLPRRGARRLPLLATVRSFASRTSSAPGTSRCRSSPTRRVRCSPSANGSARSSAGTRRSSRRRRPR